MDFPFCVCVCIRQELALTINTTVGYVYTMHNCADGECECHLPCNTYKRNWMSGVKKKKPLSVHFYLSRQLMSLTDNCDLVAGFSALTVSDAANCTVRSDVSAPTLLSHYRVLGENYYPTGTALCMVFLPFHSPLTL